MKWKCRNKKKTRKDFPSSFFGIFKAHRCRFTLFQFNKINFALFSIFAFFDKWNYRKLLFYAEKQNFIVWMCIAAVLEIKCILIMLLCVCVCVLYTQYNWCLFLVDVIFIYIFCFWNTNTIWIVFWIKRKIV